MGCTRCRVLSLAWADAHLPCEHSKLQVIASSCTACRNQEITCSAAVLAAARAVAMPDAPPNNRMPLPIIPIRVLRIELFPSSDLPWCLFLLVPEAKQADVCVCLPTGWRMCGGDGAKRDTTCILW
jgi:hypothetical protein